MAIKGATQQSSAPFNRRIVLDVIRRAGEASRKDIIDQVALSPQTVANITQELETLGLVISTRIKDIRSRGQPPMAFRLNPDGAATIGINLEPHKVSAALVNLVGDVVDHRAVHNDARDQEATLALMRELVAGLIAELPDPQRVRGIGVALPGPFDSPGLSFVGPTAFEGWSDLSILGRLEEQVGYPLFYDVDSVAGAMGEALFGVARDLEDFFYLHLGVGLGGALMVDRAAYKGDRGNATEIGHIPIEPNGKPCYCGNAGCLERYLSLHSLSEAILGETGLELSNEQVVRLIQRGDARLDAWCDEAAQHLRRAICLIENMLDPSAIIIGGSAPVELVERLVERAHPLLCSVRSGLAGSRPRVILSERREHSSILGSAVLPIYGMLSPTYKALVTEDQHPDAGARRRFGSTKP